MIRQGSSSRGRGYPADTAGKFDRPNLKCEDFTMSPNPEEYRIVRLLRELIVRNGTRPETLERRLGWAPGRLEALLEGRLRLAFGDVLQVLSLLGTTPAELFAWLYDLDLPGVAPDAAATLATAGPKRQRAMDRLFERSLRVVTNAIARRASGKRSRDESGED